MYVVNTHNSVIVRSGTAYSQTCSETCLICTFEIGDRFACIERSRYYGQWGSLWKYPVGCTGYIVTWSVMIKTNSIHTCNPQVVSPYGDLYTQTLSQRTSFVCGFKYFLLDTTRLYQSEDLKELTSRRLTSIHYVNTCRRNIGIPFI